MDYEATDRYMSSHVVTCVMNNTRFFLTSDYFATDMLNRAKVYRWPDQAEIAADEALKDPAWALGFGWQSMSVPEAMNEILSEAE